jgi:hypothetical protein
MRIRVRASCSTSPIDLAEADHAAVHQPDITLQTLCDRLLTSWASRRGMAEDIVTGLSRIKWLFVIARNSSAVYKGGAADVRQVGREWACVVYSRGACASRAGGCGSQPSSWRRKAARICGPTS